MTGLRANRSGPLSGSAAVPGDKSVSHRALMLAASAVGETVIHGLLESDDVRATADALAALGAEVQPGGGPSPDAPWRVWGRGVGGLAEPDGPLDLGNSGTGARLLAGLLASHPFVSILTGDASLRSRPMGRVMRPLERMGARFVARDGDKLPLTVIGAEAPQPIVEVPSVASAQVKSAILLAGLNAPGKTTVVERHPTRDHTERMLRAFGAEVAVEETGQGTAVTVTGQPELLGAEIRVPADISSAAFPLVAALIVPGSRVTVAGAGINPRRAGLLACLEEMGAGMEIRQHPGGEGEEPLADITVSASALKGIHVPPERAPAMIDEYPILAMAAACAKGTTRFAGVGELRVKESDRLAAMARGLAACGVTVREGEDWLDIEGGGGPPPGGATVAAALDHRIAMAFLVLGLVAENPVTIDDGTTIATSFPGFVALMASLGAEITAP